MPETTLSERRLNQVQARLRRRGNPWTARETPVSRLSEPEQRALLAPLTALRGIERPELRPHPPTPPRPSSVDWRDADGKNCVTAVKHQVGGTCVAFANTAVLESAAIIAGHADATLDLSERAVYEINSGYPASVAEFIESTGVPPETCFPHSGDQSAAAQEGWREHTYRIASHTAHSGETIEHLKADIAAYGPVKATCNVPLDFFDYGDGVYSATTQERANGFHELAVVGYDDGGGYFIAKNSWGTGWGEGGFARVAYSQYADGNLHFAAGFVTYHDVLPPRRRIVVPIALRTVNGNTVTLVDGGGLGGPTTALNTDRYVPGPWETFHIEWVDATTFALKTHDGHYVTAEGGGGIGGPNDATSPVHTDATWVGPWEQVTLSYDPLDMSAWIMTPRGRYVCAVNGGGMAPAGQPIHTNRTKRGPWEIFTPVLTHFPS